MTSKRSIKSEPVSTGAATRRTRSGATHSKKSPAEPSAEAIIIDQSDIARLAYSLWESRGCVGGSPEEDWLKAEQELLKR